MNKIEEHRKNQPMAELKRKADKSFRWKQKLYTQEDIELAAASANDIFKSWEEIKIDTGTGNTTVSKNSLDSLPVELATEDMWSF